MSYVLHFVFGTKCLSIFAVIPESSCRQKIIYMISMVVVGGWHASKVTDYTLLSPLAAIILDAFNQLTANGRRVGL
jgi:hypothetical protein